MALKAKIANKPLLDSKNYCLGVIECVLDISEREEKQGRKTVKFAAQFEFTIKSEGTHKPIFFRIWTGQNLNSEMFTNDETETKDYNRLTRLCLQLGLIEESDLSKIKEDKLPNLEELEGTKIKFKLEPSRKNQALQIPDISTIEIVK
jgi:hypothetical protein